MKAPAQQETLGIPSWFLSALPGLAVATLLTFQFWSTGPRSDGALFFAFAEKTWDQPIKIENFWGGRDHRESYVSMGLLGLAHRVGLEPIAGLRLLQFGLFASAIVAFSMICHSVFRRIGTFEAGVLTLVFSITPAYLAYFVAVSLDFVALAFLLAYLAALCSRRFQVAALFGTAFAFCKETGFLIYGLSLPFVLVYSARRFGPVGSWPNVTRAVFFLPFALKRTRHSIDGAQQIDALVGLCRQDSMAAFVFSFNLGRPEIQNYLFDLFVLNFQWLLLIPAATGAVELLRRLMKDPSALDSNHEQVNWAALVLLLGFLTTGLYVITRCPIWNSVKYVVQAMPIWLLVGYWLSVYALPTRIWRSAFFIGVAMLFGASTVWTLDPVSLGFFGTVGREPDTMLCMNSRTRPSDEPSCGNDEMIYNLQPFLH